jgi:hypothetical protein
MNGRNGGVGYAVQMVVNDRSEVLIFVRRAAHSRDRVAASGPSGKRCHISAMDLDQAGNLASLA